MAIVYAVWQSLELPMHEQTESVPVAMLYMELYTFLIRFRLSSARYSSAVPLLIETHETVQSAVAGASALAAAAVTTDLAALVMASTMCCPCRD